MRESKYWAENGRLHRWADKGFDTIPLRASQIVKELRKQENQLAAKDAEIAKLREENQGFEEENSHQQGVIDVILDIARTYGFVSGSLQDFLRTNLRYGKQLEGER